MKKFTKKNLTDHLQKSEKEDIIKEVILLFNKFQNVKDFYKAELSGDNNPILESYRKKITIAYSSANPSERRTNMNVNKLISAFRKIVIYNYELIDLLLHRVECGLESFDLNDKRSETFHNSIFNSFQQAYNLILAEDSRDEYMPRIENIIENSEKGKYELMEKMVKVIR